MRGVRSTPPKKYPRTVREFVDHDYVDRLTDEERAWLEQFDDEFYNAAFRGDAVHSSVEARRELYRVKNRRNQDIYGRGLRSGTPRTEFVDAPRDWSDHRPPDGYRDALDTFRSNLPDDGRKTVSITPEFVSARTKLDSLAGVETRDEGGGDTTPRANMAQSRIERLKENYRVIFDLGITVHNHQFKGAECHAADRMMRWLEATAEKLDAKLKALGVDMQAELKKERSSGQS